MIHLVTNSFNRSLLVIVFAILYASPGFSRDYFFPKEEEGKWGVYMHYKVTNKKGYSEDNSKWLFKPRWDRVWFDTSRCSYTGNGCNGFITLRKGKYGYAWSNGKTLDNEYEAIDIYNHTAKKNGKWGGFQEHQQILTHEYDSLLFNPLSREFRNMDTSYVGFAALKDSKWTMIAVKVVDGSAVGITNILPSPFDGYAYYVNGAAVKSNEQWYFVNLRQWGKQIYSQAFDSIKRVGFLYAAKKAGKWFLIDSENPDAPTGKGWDRIEKTVLWEYLEVWENGLAGLVYYSKKDKFKELISPRAHSVQIRTTSNGREASVIELAENGQKRTYDRAGQPLSSTGDATVLSTRILGPFRISYHGNGISSVLDANSNTELINKVKVDVEYVNDPDIGHILNLKKDNFYYGLYHYATKTYIAPKYTSKFKVIGSSLILSTVRGTGASDDLVVWDKKTLQQIVLPFIAKGYKDKYQVVLSDANGLWYELTGDKFTYLPKSKVINFRTIDVGGIEIEWAEDYSKILRSINGKSVNEPLESAVWLDDKKRNIYVLTMQGKKTEYFKYDGRAKACNYSLSAGTKKIAFLFPEVPWPGTKFPVPIILADSSQKLVLINALDNRRIILPITTMGKGAVFEGRTYAFRQFVSYSSLVFSDTITVKKTCTACSGGFINVEQVTLIKGQTTYETKKIVEYKEEDEKYFDQFTRRYYTRKKLTPITKYETIEKKQSDKSVKTSQRVKCSVCDGTTIHAQVYEQTVLWDGQSLKKGSLNSFFLMEK